MGKSLSRDRYLVRLRFPAIVVIFATIASELAPAEGLSGDRVAQWHSVPIPQTLTVDPPQLSANDQAAQASPAASTIRIVQSNHQERTLISESRVTQQGNRAIHPYPSSMAGKLSEIQIVASHPISVPSRLVAENPFPSIGVAPDPKRELPPTVQVEIPTEQVVGIAQPSRDLSDQLRDVCPISQPVGKDVDCTDIQDESEFAHSRLASVPYAGIESIAVHPEAEQPEVNKPRVFTIPSEVPAIETQSQKRPHVESEMLESLLVEPGDFVAATEQPQFQTPAIQSTQNQIYARIPELLSTPPVSPDALPVPTNGPLKNELTLAETIRLGLEFNKDVVVLSMDPSIEATTIETAKAPFDPVSGATTLGGQSDVQVRSLIQTFGAPADFLDTNSLQPFQRPNNLYTSRKLYSGGEVELGFSTDYEDYFPVGPQLLVNPGWDSAINFRYDQPLFAGRGTDFTMAPIRIAQANQNQSQLEFQAEIRRLTRDIELAYWELAGADLALQAYESFLARGKEMFENQLKREKLGKSALPDVLQAKNLLEEFEIQTADQLQRRNVAEDNLRQVMGLPAHGDRTWYASNGELDMVLLPLAAVDNVAAYDAELPWEEYVRMAEQRPELLAQQAAIRAARISVSLAQNQLLPDVSARANYSINGLAENLGDSIATIGRHEYKTWSVGLIYERPFGLRAQHAALRRAKLTLVQESTEYDRIRHDILHSLRRSEDVTLSTNSLYKLRQKRVVTAKAQMEAFDALYLEDRVSLFIRLDSERNLASARAEAAQAWTRRQLAVVQRNYEANLLSPMCQVEIASPTDP